jgi:hypothetical protein
MTPQWYTYINLYKCINKTISLYTAFYCGYLNSYVFPLCKTTIVKLSITEMHKEEIIQL